VVAQWFEQDRFEFRYFPPGDRTEVRDRLGRGIVFRSRNPLRQQVRRMIGPWLAYIERYEHRLRRRGLLETTCIVRPGGNEITYRYDSAHPDPRLRGRLLEVRQRRRPGDPAEERVTRIRYQPDQAPVTAITSAAGLLPGANPDRYTTRFRYDAKGHLVEVLPPPASLFDREGNVVGQQQPRFAYDYNQRGQLTLATDPSGVAIQTIDADVGPERFLPTARVYDPGGDELISRFEYDALGRASTVISPVRARAEVKRDGFNRVTALRGPLEPASAPFRLPGGARRHPDPELATQQRERSACRSPRPRGRP